MRVESVYRLQGQLDQPLAEQRLALRTGSKHHRGRGGFLGKFFVLRGVFRTSAADKKPVLFSARPRAQ